MLERERLREQRRLDIMERLEKQGLVGMKIGKHKVAEPDIDVQLGENFTESLRGLKVCAGSYYESVILY
jgi:nucleolar protein 53